jgi:hypothetical protein
MPPGSAAHRRPRRACRRCGALLRTADVLVRTAYLPSKAQSVRAWRTRFSPGCGGPGAARLDTSGLGPGHPRRGTTGAARPPRSGVLVTSWRRGAVKPPPGSRRPDQTPWIGGGRGSMQCEARHADAFRSAARSWRPRVRDRAPDAARSTGARRGYSVDDFYLARATMVDGGISIASTGVRALRGHRRAFAAGKEVPAEWLRLITGTSPIRRRRHRGARQLGRIDQRSRSG